MEDQPEQTCPACLMIWKGMVIIALAILVGLATSKQIGSLPVPQVEASPS